MNPIFEAITAIYKKDPKEIEVNTSIMITVSKWLSFDKDNLQVLKEIVPFIFYLSPKHYYYIAWLNIPQKYKVPFLKKYEEVNKPEKNELEQKIQSVLGYSDREFFYNKKAIDSLISKDEMLWKERLGIKC
jgi:hypothetical protein